MSEIPGIDDAAMLLVALGADAATEVMRHLGDQERTKLVQALARVQTIEAREIERIEKHFAESVAGSPGALVDGRDFARTVAARTAGKGASVEVAEDEPFLAMLDGAGSSHDDLGRVLEAVSSASLSELLLREHPQVAAVIVAHLDAPRAAEAVAGLPEELQTDLLERVAHLGSIAPEVRGALGGVLREELQGAVRSDGGALGGPRVLAEILNCSDKDVEDRLLTHIGAGDADLAQTIRTLMFTFDDCAKLDNRSLQALLKEVVREDLLLALKTATPELLEKIFANVSSRAADILREDLAAMGAVRLADVEAAQARIISTLRELEADGKVVVASKGKGDVLV